MLFRSIKFRDAETGEIRFIDTDDRRTRTWFAAQNVKRIEERKTMFLKSRLDSINIDTSLSYIKPLVDFFKMREKRW